MKYYDWYVGAAPPANADNVRLAAPSMHEAGGELVLGCAVNYTPAQLALFVTSLRAHHDGPAALIVHDDQPVIDWLAENRVDALIVDRHPPSAPHIVVRRIAYYLHALELLPRPRDILAPDVRDVAFQGSPFARRPDDAPLTVFQEAEDDGLSDNKANWKWVRRSFGDGVIAPIADKPVICAGTIMGGPVQMARLCRLILAMNLRPRNGVAGAFANEQAMLNVITHLNLIEHELELNYQRVATIGAAAAHKLTLNDRHEIIGPNGVISPIVHQFDRHPELVAVLETRYGVSFDQRAAKPRGRIAAKLEANMRSFRRRLPELR